ncbi:hypothetical protein PoB_001365400 [Plakobranchus ocellatus]|uniref:Uncharacterized protein n=1 Tax=Plakobranchus ocellatus TaxID=259542 RepID=A0AAV3YVQ0_9GAST|nr:hypothetical protein PoB_001365400 [Plakobranchus ocellatus]
MDVRVENKTQETRNKGRGRILRMELPQKGRSVRQGPGGGSRTRGRRVRALLRAGSVSPAHQDPHQLDFTQQQHGSIQFSPLWSSEKQVTFVELRRTSYLCGAQKNKLPLWSSEKQVTFVEFRKTSYLCGAQKNKLPLWSSEKTSYLCGAGATKCKVRDSHLFMASISQPSPTRARKPEIPMEQIVYLT